MATSRRSNSNTIRRTPSFEDRLRSFAEWPTTVSQTKTSVAAAGFRFTRDRDKVRCDTCGIKLHNWRRHDDPLVEHLRYAPDCPFVAKYLENQDSETSKKSDEKETRAIEPESGSVEAGTLTLDCSESNTSRSFQQTRSDISKNYKVSKRWLRAQLDRQVVQLVLGKGHSRNDVKCAIANHFLQTQDEYKEAANLLQAVYHLEDKRELCGDVKTDSVGATSSDPQGQCGDNLSAIPSVESPSQSSKQHEAVSPNSSRPSSQTSTTETKKVKSTEERKATPPGSKSKVSADARKGQKGDKGKGSLCVVCKKAQVGALLLPCSHLNVCTDCAVKVHECPTCDASVQHRLRVYIA